MNNLYDILAEAEDGEAMAMLGREFGLTPQQTQAAVMALLPAISTGLKQATATPEGLAELFGVMGQQRDLSAMFGAPDVAFAPQGRAAGNDVLSVIFGSPDVSRAVVDQAQQFSGVTGSILQEDAAGDCRHHHLGPDGRARAGGAEGFCHCTLLGQRARRYSRPDFRPRPAGRRAAAAGSVAAVSRAVARRSDDADPDRSQPGRRSRSDHARTRKGLARGTDQAGDHRWRADHLAGRSGRPVPIPDAGRSARAGADAAPGAGANSATNAASAGRRHPRPDLARLARWQAAGLDERRSRAARHLRRR